MRNSLPSVMQGRFARSPMPSVQRSKFDMSNGRKMTANAGFLYPIMCEEVLPGDTWSLQMTAFARLMTLLRPIMDNVHFDVHYFFVPKRLLWSNWERFNGARDTPDASIDYIIPSVKDADEESDTLTVTPLSLGDYFGLPTVVTIQADDLPSALPFRAYNLIYNEWYRSESLQDKLQVPLGDGPDPISYYTIQRRGKRHDYFTSLLPWPQKGDAVTLSLATFGDVPVIGDGTLGLDNGTSLFGLQSSVSTGVMSMSQEAYNTAVGVAVGTTFPAASRTVGVTTNPATSGLSALTSQLTAQSITIQDLRTAFAYQQLLEADGRGGTRYTEIIFGRYGVSPMDARLQRPEFLGGGTVPMSTQAIAQTAPSPDTPTPDDAQGNLAAYGQVVSFTGFHRSFEEHGYILGIANIRTDITYQQGMRRMWSRKTRYDFYDPYLANLGEQAVLNKEIYYDFDGTFANNVLGYAPRWDEMRYIPSTVVGAMRSNYPGGSLDSWHLALDFSATPVLNADYIRDFPPIERVVAVPTEPHFLVDMYFRCSAVRPMPIYGIPGLRRL